MSYLTVRAEQALIGALLTDQPPPAELAYLRAEDFGHRALRQIYTTICELRDTTPTAQLPDTVAARQDTPGVDADWLRQLKDSCPQPAHLPAYARMIQVAAFRREMATHGERIAAAAAAGHTTDPAYARMAQALTRQTQVHSALSALDQTQALHLPQQPATQPEPASRQTLREDELLADLLAHPEQAGDLARIIGPDTFTSDQRREVFTTMVMLAEAGDPIDEIILAWTIYGQRAAAELEGTATRRQSSAEPIPAYLTRLANTTVTSATAVAIGYELVLADTRAALDTAVKASQNRQTPHIGADAATRPAPASQLDPGLHPPTSPAPGQQPTIDRGTGPTP